MPKTTQLLKKNFSYSLIQRKATGKTRVDGISSKSNCKVGRAFLMVIFSDFRMGQQRDADHQEDAPTLF